MTKHCKKCNKEKEYTQFYKNNSNRDRLSSWCKECSNASQKERYINNKESISKKASIRYQKNKEEHKRKGKQWRYKKVYGISFEDFEQLKKDQNGKCYICEKQFIEGSVSDAKAVLDHCHTTGKIRKVLCNRCNSAMGWFEDNPVLLEKAADYLRKHNEQH